jgi:hypothetical protein
MHACMQSTVNTYTKPDRNCIHKIQISELCVLAESCLMRVTNEANTQKGSWIHAAHLSLKQAKHGCIAYYTHRGIFSASCLTNLIRGRSSLPWLLHFSGHLSLLMQCRGCKMCDMGQPIVAPIYRAAIASRYHNDNACGVQGDYYIASIPS